MKYFLISILGLFGFVSQAQTLHIESGGTLFIDDPTVINGSTSVTPSLYVEGNITNDGTIQNNGELQMTGDITNNGVYSSTGDDVFKGSAMQGFSGNFNGASSFYNLIINNGGNDLNAFGNADIEEAINLENGVFATGGATVHLKNTSGSALTGTPVSGSLNNYVNGSLRQDIAVGQTYTFEVGDFLHGNQPVSIVFNNLGGASYINMYYSSTGAGSMPSINIPSGCTGLYDKKTGTWTISANGVNGTYDYTITLSPGGLNAAALAGSLYDALQKDATIMTNPCAGTLGNHTASNLNAFSQFRIIGGPTVALPATVTLFEGSKLESSDLLRWKTSAEYNSAYFNIAHSTNGVDFKTIGSVDTKAPNGNSNVDLSYELEHLNPVLGHNYYRLEQVDIDGRSVYHNQIVDLIWGSNGSSVSIYPNPTTNYINVDLYNEAAANIVVKVLDMSGRVVKVVNAKSEKGMNKILVDISEVASGLYTIKVLSNDKQMFTSKVNKMD